jgi:plasmid stabilization system protein ParE
MALKIVYLERAYVDLARFRIYYERYFPEGMASANARLLKCVRLMSEFPNMGRTVGREPRRCFSIPDTPYTLVYQQKEERLEIVRVLDQRSEKYLEDLLDHDHPH